MSKLNHSSKLRVELEFVVLKSLMIVGEKRLLNLNVKFSDSRTFLPNSRSEGRV